MSQTHKDQSIETLRGIAILLVVAGYIIHDDLARGVDDSSVASAFRFLYYIFTPIRMPLFTVISAYLYAASPAARGTFQKLVFGKARRIMIPFAVVSTIQYAFFSVVSFGEHQPLAEIYKIYFVPYEQMWFLYSVFWIFILVGILDSLKLLATIQRWLVFLAVSLLFHVAFEPTKLFSIYGVNYLLPFFLLGYGLRRFPEALFSRRTISIFSVTSLAAYAVYIFCFITPLPGEWVKLYQILGVLISITAVPLFFYFRKTVSWLAWIGSYAFGIYLFNKLAVVPADRLLDFSHWHQTVIVFGLQWITAIVFAIAIQKLMGQFDVTRRFVLGLKKKTGGQDALAA
ncbi:MAG: acyltransferase [Candidatus Omnitrophica bacterium]|nr:acyltransferase [Candidatus Omnitrophota bacterium]